MFGTFTINFLLRIFIKRQPTSFTTQSLYPNLLLPTFLFIIRDNVPGRALDSVVVDRGDRDKRLANDRWLDRYANQAFSSTLCQFPEHSIRGHCRQGRLIWQVLARGKTSRSNVYSYSDFGFKIWVYPANRWYSFLLSLDGTLRHFSSARIAKTYNTSWIQSKKKKVLKKSKEMLVD